MNLPIDPKDIEEADYEEATPKPNISSSGGDTPPDHDNDSLLKKPLVWIIAGLIIITLLFLALSAQKNESGSSDKITADTPAKKVKPPNPDNADKKKKKQAKKKDNGPKPSEPPKTNKVKDKNNTPPPAFKIDNKKDLQEEKSEAATLLLETIVKYARQSPKKVRKNEYTLINYINKRIARDKKARRSFKILNPKKLEIRYIPGTNRIFTFYRDGDIIKVNSEAI